MNLLDHSNVTWRLLGNEPSTPHNSITIHHVSTCLNVMYKAAEMNILNAFSFSCSESKCLLLYAQTYMKQNTIFGGETFILRTTIFVMVDLMSFNSLILCINKKNRTSWATQLVSPELATCRKALVGNDVSMNLTMQGLGPGKLVVEGGQAAVLNTAYLAMQIYTCNKRGREGEREKEREREGKREREREIEKEKEQEKEREKQ